MTDELYPFAKQARVNRFQEQNVLIGFCYQNVKELSRILTNNNVTHTVHQVGIIDDVIQYHETTLEDCQHASETGQYRSGVPETVPELNDAANHYIVTVGDAVVEICSEHRGDSFRDIYIGPWPTDQYLRLKDGETKL